MLLTTRVKVAKTFDFSLMGASSRSCKYVLNTLMQVFYLILSFTTIGFIDKSLGRVCSCCERENTGQSHHRAFALALRRKGSKDG
uniref:Uncharacterized protein n=1 Tax=Lactuca sativa TaxID=4236 RepID=A0A9R1UKV6_LACSA|nr:hypothetical protein LSAT_V11C800423640 [Lactuca sativa]